MVIWRPTKQSHGRSKSYGKIWSGIKKDSDKDQTQDVKQIQE